MIKKSVFEDELIAGMQKELLPYEKKQGMESLVKAVEYLQAAAEIFEESGLTAKADQVLRILSKIGGDEQDAKGKPNKPKNPTHISDSHTHGLTSEKMIENLKQHGVVFNMADDGAADDLLNIDVDDNAIEAVEGENSFEKTFEDSD